MNLMWKYWKFIPFFNIDDSHPCAQPKFQLAKDARGCHAIIQRWYHNHATGKCEELEYDGCNQNENNFLTKEDCEKTCNEWHQQHKDHHHQRSEHGDCQHGHGNHEHHEGHEHGHDHEHGHHDHSHHHHWILRG